MLWSKPPDKGKSPSTSYRQTFRRDRKLFSVQMTLGALACSKSWSRPQLYTRRGGEDNVALEHLVLVTDSEELAVLCDISCNNARRLPARVETHE